ncbi:polysaccharide deacetylase family protein [Pseudooctadecabacter jejudonensis]|uniref:Chitooligosaccharide deacetylase n=1 Tax=Pseudooctadecabacter jejudonensis TaxID=1391910 RepID=A0A1Y5ST76_9RHOB|nr:polysaccharide deacetylase family protein [Pseudooctadecabacter jejudonensis]SLN45959.1 Polysaccharide deacetylase [Pseudooctadecabacter jejudonensis]
MADRRKIRALRVGLAGAGVLLGLVLFAAGAAIWGAAVIAASVVSLAWRRGVPIMVYHSVSPDASWLPWARNISVRPEVFARHMGHLARSGWTVVPDQLLGTDRPVPRRAVVLHFDDAYLNTLIHAVPVLRDHALPATIFASSDFIDPSTGLRTQERDIGYLNGAELRHIDEDPLFEIGCHGKDHARVPVAGQGHDRPDACAWGPETAWLWSLMPGNKSRWFEGAPPAAPYVPANDSSLTGRIVQDGSVEDEAAFHARVRTQLQQARIHLSGLLGRDITYLCWPFDRVTPAALKAAKAAGFQRFTGGRGDNRNVTDPVVLSRTHVNDFAAGAAPLWVETLVFRAKLEVASGNLLWLPITLVANRRRKRASPFLHGHIA